MSLPKDHSLNKYSLEFQYSELQSATNNFASCNRLGKGAFGAVYRGVRDSDGTEIAIKTLDLPQEAGFEEEVRVLSKFRHPNLVILLGFGRRGAQRQLVYELLEGGDVYHRLQRSTREDFPYLWRARISTAYDACCGLSHLHNSKPKAFHRDIKSANILLDRNGTAKMADFGLACLSHSQSHKVESAGGTPGYACPHYARTRVVTQGSEVYSFGIVLLELLTAQAPAWISRGPQAGKKQYEFLVTVINEDVRVVMSLLDAKAQWPPDVGRSVAELALRCSSYTEAQRPNFAEVVATLRSLRDARGSPPLLPASPAAPALQPVLQAPVPQVGVAGSPLEVALAPSFAAAVPAGQVVYSPSAPPAFEPAAAPPQQVGPCDVTSRRLQYVQHQEALLWTLECVYADGLAVGALPAAGRSVEHRQHVEVWPPAPLTVGRRYQEDLFAALLCNEEIRNMVSREHFQVWVSDTASPPQDSEKVPCTFFITNLSANCTSVNGYLLDTPDKHVQLRDGDVIGLGTILTSDEGMHYTPFLQFRFHFEGAVLCDAPPAMLSAVLAAPASGVEGALAGSMDAAPPSSGAASSSSGGGSSGEAGASSAGGCGPRFALEIGGRGLKDGIAEGSRRLVHGHANEPFAPLVLGRQHLTGFWFDLLHEEAFQSLSREHVVFEPVAAPAAASGVAVRNLSSLRPVRVCPNADEESLRAVAPLAEGGCQELRHRDVVVLNAAKGCSLWVVFHDLHVVARGVSPSGDAACFAVVGGA